mgnify:CR=1 FL=1
MFIKPLRGRSRSIIVNTVKESIVVNPIKIIQSMVRLLSYPNRKAEQTQSANRKYIIESGIVDSPAALRVVVMSIMAFKAGINSEVRVVILSFLA